MPKVMAKNVEMDLTFDQVMALVRQLTPEEQSLVRRAIEPTPWDQRLQSLLTRVWERVERCPITEEEVDAEVRNARSDLHAQSGH